MKCKGCGLAGGLKNVNVLKERYVYRQIEIAGIEYAISIFAE